MDYIYGSVSGALDYVRRILMLTAGPPENFKKKGYFMVHNPGLAIIFIGKDLSLIISIIQQEGHLGLVPISMMSTLCL